MKCKLCLQDRPLLNSHVIPEFFYGPVYDSKHRLGYGMGHYTPVKLKQLQRGIRERLLCKGCEGKLGVLERYFSQTLIYRNGIEITKEDDYFVISNLNYAKFKLFLISILWRASVSTLSYFSHLHVSEHDELMRQMLLDSDPGSREQFGCSVTLLRMGEHRSIHLPTTISKGGLTIHWFIVPAFLFQFIEINDEPVEEQFQILQSGILERMVTLEGVLRLNVMSYAEFIGNFSNGNNVLGKQASTS